MPRARFAKLPAGQRDAILDAALDEFAAHGYTGASLNRIIDAAGISKGSMYYYFDDKADLYVHLVQTRMLQLLDDPVQSGMPVADDPGVYWSALEAASLHAISTFSAAPMIAALLRDAFAGTGAPVMRQAQQGMDAAMLPWIRDTIHAGQRIGAVRTDLPVELLVAIVGALGQAMDTWLITQDLEQDQYARATRDLVGILRRALEP